VLGFAKGPSLVQSEKHPISSNHYEYNYQWQQMLNGQYIEMRLNRALRIFGHLSEVIEKWFGCCYALPTYWQPL